jgi:hypothetical protein
MKHLDVSAHSNQRTETPRDTAKIFVVEDAVAQGAGEDCQRVLKSEESDSGMLQECQLEPEPPR